MPFIPEPFVPARGLASAHAQTLFGALQRPADRPALRRERWETPDGDFVDLDVLPGPRRSPRLLVLHGLEGSSRSGYVAVLLGLAAERGWGAVALNFRSCSGEPNRLARSYTAGDTADARWVLGRLRESAPGPLYAAGFSLGGNVLARALAEEGERSPVAAAAVVSTPFDLAACAARIDAAGAWSSLYRWWYLRTLKGKARRKADRFPEAFASAPWEALSSLRAFDEHVTAPLHGFAGADAYYAASSSGPGLSRIRTPTFVLNAQDDPLAPASLLPAAARDNPRLVIAEPERGGHVGFIAGSLLRPVFWAEAQLMRFFAEAG